MKSLTKPAGPLARRRQRASAVNPAWHQAACYGRRDAGDLTALNPYAYGSQCWIIYKQARCAAAASFAPLAPLRGHPSVS